MSLSKIQQVRARQNKKFQERQQIIDTCLMALLTSEHVLMLGPPGTGKSALVRSITSDVGGRFFERLLTKFSPLEELFGPVSLKGLEQDKFVRNTSGKLPEAEVAFVDETFKANPAILNSLLTVMNERLFHNDNVPTKCPLVSLFGASNEMPESKELDALWDRFILRVNVEYIKTEGALRALLTADDTEDGPVMSMDDLRVAQAAVKGIKVTDATVMALIDLRNTMIAEGFQISDRRLKKVMKLLPAVAYLADEAATETCPEDLTGIVDALWREPGDRSKIAKIVGKFADPVSVKANEILDAAREVYQKVLEKKGDLTIYKKEATTAVDRFVEQEARLADLSKTAGRRAARTIDAATAEIHAMHEEFSRVIATNLRMRMNFR